MSFVQRNLTMAAASFPSQDSANQVGGSFVTQYYNLLHQHPEQVYQFYKDESTMTRIDGNNTETAIGIIEIHSVISVLKFTSIEIKTANFLKSLMGGIMVMVSGLVQAGRYEKRRKFIQSFFLATQETGYFVLNDFFHYVDEEYFCTPALLAQGNFENFTTVKPVPSPEAVSGYSLDAPNHQNEIVGPAHVQANGLSSYDYSDPQKNIACQPDSNSLIEETLISPFSNVVLSEETLISPFSNVTLSAPTEEPIRHTYASILKSGVTDTGETETQLPPVYRSSPVISEQQPDQSHTPLSDKSSFEAPAEINTAFAYEVESKSVFVKNVSRYFTEADLENEFKKFGRLAPDGVAIRSNKETGRYYAFVEYEDTEGVENALKASPVDINGWNVYVEQRRRSNNTTASRGRGKGRGGRFGGRGRGRADGNRLRVNGFEDEDSNPESTRSRRYQSY